MYTFLFQSSSSPSSKYIPHLSGGLSATELYTLKGELYLSKAVIFNLKKRKDKHCDWDTGKSSHALLPTAVDYELKSHLLEHIQKTWKYQVLASLRTASDSKAIPFSNHLPGSSMWTMIQLKATSAPIFPVKYTAFRHASRGKPISANCITDDSSMSDATENNRIFWCKKK